jgi:tetratricopeptide (TPR) repeat protein
MKLLEGIQLHELVLIILGFILGLVLIFVFLFFALRGKINLKLLYGFIAPLVMIGYPSIQTMEFSKDVIKIEKLVSDVNRDPTDTVAQRALLNSLGALPASRCKTSPYTLYTIAEAQASLGLYDSAKVTINKAVELDPKSVKAQGAALEIEQKWKIQNQFREKANELDGWIKELEKNPKSQNVLDTIAENLIKIKVMDAPVRVEARHALVVAKAAAIIGERKAAEVITEAVLKDNPKQESAKTLRDELQNKVIEKKFGSRRPSPKVAQKIEAIKNQPEQMRVQAAPQVAAPAAVDLDTIPQFRFKLIPKAAQDTSFRKWDKNN